MLQIMKAILEFNLDEPEDQMAHERTMKSNYMAIVLWEVEYNLKKEVEYSKESGDSRDELTIFYNLFNELLEEWDINIDRLNR